MHGTSTATLAEMAILESSSRLTREERLALESGETLSKLLSRAGFDKQIGATVIRQLISVLMYVACKLAWALRLPMKMKSP